MFLLISFSEDRRTFPFAEPRLNMKRVSFGPRDFNKSQIPRDVKQSTPLHQTNMPPPRPPPYRTSVDSISNNYKHLPNNIQQNSPNKSSVIRPGKNLSPRNPVNDFDQWRDLYQHSAIRHGRHDSCSSVRSCDDDGGSTTTSGSYTLDQEEIDIEMYRRQADLVV